MRYRTSVSADTLLPAHHLTPHCGAYCRLDSKGRPYHHHSGKSKYQGYRKGRWRRRGDLGTGIVLDEGNPNGARRAMERDHDWEAEAGLVDRGD